MLWKEYRQQRAIWLAIAIIGTSAIVAYPSIAGQGSELEGFQNPRIAGILNVMVFALAAAQGVISGAVLLAGEKDEGTLTFLDTLSAACTHLAVQIPCRPVYRVATKFLAGWTGRWSGL